MLGTVSGSASGNVRAAVDTVSRAIPLTEAFSVAVLACAAAGRTPAAATAMRSTKRENSDRMRNAGRARGCRLESRIPYRLGGRQRVIQRDRIRAGVVRPAVGQRIGLRATRAAGSGPTTDGLCRRLVAGP